MVDNQQYMGGSHNQYYRSALEFDASKFDSIYTTKGTVKPLSLVFNYYIKS